MSSSRNSQPNNETPILQIDAATFQAAVSAAVTAVMTHLNANNANVSGIVRNNSNQSNNQVHQWVTNYHDTPNFNPKSNKRKFWDRFKGKSPQGTNKRQQPMAAFAATTFVTPTTIPTSIPVIPNATRQYAGNLPKCDKCSFHHQGRCRQLHSKKCNKNGHTICYCRTQIQHITSITNVEISRICHLCGVTGHFKKDCPTEKNEGGTGGETTPDPRWNN